jgi:hypothetical protein
MKVRLYDGMFDHSLQEDGAYTASMGKIPQKIEWTKDDQPCDISVFTETHLSAAKEVDSKIKIAWLVESAEINPWAVHEIKKVEEDFDYIFTHNKELVNLSDKYKQVYVGSSRIPEEDIDKDFEKNNLVSIIASNKRMVSGHLLRHDIIKEIENVDIWGSGYKYFKSKSEPLESYMYSIAVMNARYDYYFTEILIDCFMYKVIPIFWGCPNIGDIFDIRGMYLFNNIKELNAILDKINLEDYNSRLEYVNNNYEIAKNNFMITDDIIANKIKEVIS